jgi:hypothetical protein
MQQQSSANSMLSKDFPNFAREALQLIRSNHNRIAKHDLFNLANERIFLNKFNEEQNVWVKVRRRSKLLINESLLFSSQFSS